MMKKVYSILLCVLLACASLTACAPSADKSADGLTIGLIQLVEHPSLDEIRTAFTAQVEAEAARLGLDIKIDYKNAQADASLTNSICRQFVDDGVDVIVAIATPTAQGAASITQSIPIVFSAVTDPVGAGLLTNMAAPEGNITGTSDAIAVDRIFDLANELTPGIQTFGFLYNKGESNSVSVIEQAKAHLDAIGIAYVERVVTTSGEVQQAARVLLEESDAIFTPIDNTVADAMTVLAAEALAVRKPVYPAADSMVNDGGLATVGVNYTNLGTQTADMAIRVLTGIAVKDIPVEVLTDVGVVVNPETAAALGVDVSRYTE